MSNSILIIIENLGHSEPVFKVDNFQNLQLSLVVKEQYNPTEQLDSEDPVSQIIAGHYNEYFDSGKNRFVKDSDILFRTYQTLKIAIRDIFIKGSPLKKPQHSSVVKFLTSVNLYNNNELCELFVSLYRYIKPHVDVDNRFYNRKTCPHTANLIAILEKAREKYERK